MYTIAEYYLFNKNNIEDILSQLYINDSLKKILVVEDLEVLNDKEKRFIYMLYWEGYTIEEISKLDNVSINTLYSLRKRIYKKLSNNHKL